MEVVTVDRVTADTVVRRMGTITTPGTTPVVIQELKTTQNPIPTGMTTSGLRR